MPEEIRAYLLCRWFGWSEVEYLDATVEFCDLSLAIRDVELKQRGEAAQHGQ
jgi:hypothetical protein